MDNFYKEHYEETHQLLLIAIRTLAGISEAKYTDGDKKEILNRVSGQAQEALDKIMGKIAK